MEASEPGRTLRKLRILAGLSQKEFADQLGVDASYVSRLERGLRDPSLDLLRKASGVLKIPSGLLIAFAVWGDLPIEERTKYGPVMTQLLELTGLFQMGLPLETNEKAEESE